MALSHLDTRRTLKAREPQRASSLLATENELHAFGAESARSIEQQQRRLLAHVRKLLTRTRRNRPHELLGGVCVGNAGDFRVRQAQRFCRGEDRGVGNA